MKVLMWVYIALWVLTVGPLWLFNIKKFRRRIPGEKAKTNVRVLLVVSVITVLLSALWGGLYLDNRDTRYELTAEEIFGAQADYITGRADMEGVKTALEKYRKDDFDLTQVAKVAEDKKGAKEVRFQISDRVGAVDYEKASYGFPETEKIDRDNPIYVMCKMQIDGKDAYYVIRLVRNDSMEWKLDDIQPANEKQIKSVTMPDAEFGGWLE